MRSFFVSFLVLLSVQLGAQNSCFHKVDEAYSTYLKKGDSVLYLKQWDTLFYDELVSPLYKANLLNVRFLPLDSLIKRAKSLARTTGFTPTFSEKYASTAYRRIFESDSALQTRHLEQIHQLAQEWEKQLNKKQQEINYRIRELWSKEHDFYQAFHNNNPYRPRLLKNERDSLYLPILHQLMDDYLQICEEQACVPNSFDNNWEDQSRYMLIFWHLISTFDEEEQLILWDKNMKYFITAYQSGKISNEFCCFYDQDLSLITGQQYFGTRKNIPVKNPETLEQRQKDFAIDQLIKMLQEIGRY